MGDCSATCDRRRLERYRGPSPQAVQLPPREAAEYDPRREPARRDSEGTPTTAFCRQPHAVRDRFSKKRVVGGAQIFTQLPVNGDPFVLFRPGLKPGLDFAAARLGHAAIHVRLQFGFADAARVAHLTIFNLAEGGWPCIMARSFSRARESRDMTVPIGIPRVRATSS